MVSLAKAHSAFTSLTIAAWERVVSDVFHSNLLLYCQPRDHLTRGLTHSVKKFSDSTPVRSHWSRPLDKYSRQYLYWNKM